LNDGIPVVLVELMVSGVGLEITVPELGVAVGPYPVVDSELGIVIDEKLMVGETDIEDALPALPEFDDTGEEVPVEAPELEV
jgi:hypothetical protein